MTTSMTRRHAATVALGAVAAALARPPRAVAAGLTQAVILNVSGSISGGGPNGMDYDRPMLEALPQHSFTTKTPWYSGAETFAGVLMRDLMRLVGASGDRLLVVALNDYTSEIPIGDFTQYDVVLAMRRGGVDMPVSDKGPLFVVYPYDSDPALQTPKYYGRSAWQVAQFVVK